MSKESTGENGAVLGSGEYWSRVNRSTFFGGLMRRASEANYQETLWETGSRASDMVEEIHEDLQEHKKRLSSIDSGARNALAKQVQGLYDVCRMADTSCTHSRECITMLNLTGLFSNPFSDERAIETAIRKLKNNPDFFSSECIDLIEKAADWGIAFAAGSSEKKRAFLEDVAQGKGKDFFQEVADAYRAGSDAADTRGKCGHSIGSREYLDRMERVVFRQDVPTMFSAHWGSPDYDGLLKSSLESIAHQLERDLERNERENNYITDDTAKELKLAVGELERCDISTGSASGKIEKLAWFVGGDPAKIRELQSKLNATGMVPHLLEDGVYGAKTQEAETLFVDRFRNNLKETLLNKEAMDYVHFQISIMNFNMKVASQGNFLLSGVATLQKLLYDNRQIIQRGIWKTGAALYLRKSGYDVAALLLEHSLESMPSTLHFSQSHWVTEKIMQSNGFQNAFQKLEENIQRIPNMYATPGEIGIDFQQTGDRDLYFGIGKCTLQYACVRVDCNVIINFKIEDEYNFEEIRTFWGDQESHIKFNPSIGAVANDAGLLSQADGVITPYRIRISFQKTVRLENIWL
ncbi:hypothetical protein [uncultured Oscillibacter sp.]|uniref:hypothetical protein n=1 Tax=uncultured Oscillibacter sp. TaxID=876091 RepID=UPI0025E8DEAD|nr:hypothetical protein [uncultured Oscillibacter sp.]